METTALNNKQEYEGEPPAPGTSDKIKSSFLPQEDIKPTSKGVENAKKRLRAFSIQKKSSLSPVPLPKPICTTVGSVGTVFIGKLASSKPALKPGDIEEVVDAKKPPKPPKPGTSKLQNVSSPLADYLNVQKKTLSEIEAMKKKMELVDLGIPLGLICPAPNSDKAMPTKAMPPIKSMLLARKMRVFQTVKKEAKKPLQKRSRPAAAPGQNPAKVDEIIREAKKAKAEGKSFKFSYEKLLPTYQNPFQKKDKDREPPIDDYRQSRDRKKYSDNFRRYSGHKDEKRSRDWHRDRDRMRANVIREREKREKNKRSKDKSKRDRSRDRDNKSKETDAKDVKSKDTKSKEKIDTINLSDEDDDVQEVIDVPEKNVRVTDVNLKDFVVCDSWSETEDKKDSTPKNVEDKNENTAKTTPVVKHIDPMEQLKQSLIKEISEPPVEKVEKLQPVTDSFKFEIEDENEDEEILDMFAETTAAMEKFVKTIPLPATSEKGLYDSPVPIRFDYDESVEMDESFLESVIAEIKQEDIDENAAQDKGLVEYDISPKDRESITPEIDDRIREMYSSKSDCSDGLKSVESVKSTESGFKSTESGYKSTESGFKSTESGRKSSETNSKANKKATEVNKLNESEYSTDSRSKSVDSHKSSEGSQKSKESDQKSIKSGSMLLPIEPLSKEADMSKSTVDSLETWSFVLKICQPILFRHDKNKCYKETRGSPKLWFAENPRCCDCVKDRSVVYEELEMCKMDLVNSVYGKEPVQEAVDPEARGWYPATFLTSRGAAPPRSEWEGDDSQEQPTPPPARDELVLDREYQKFMEAVWPEVEGSTKSETPLNTPVRETKKRPGEEPDVKKKKMKLEGKMSSEGWSQDSELEEDVEKIKKQKEKSKRKRKHSTTFSDSDEESPAKKKKALKKEKKERAKIKGTKRQRLSKKYLKKLKEKHEKQLKKKKKLKMVEESDAEDQDKETRRREKKLKKKKLQKQKKKNLKKKSRARSTSSSSDSESDRRSKKKDKKKKKKKHKKRKQSTSESNSEDLFDVNVLNNIKTERLTDDEKKHFSPKKHREIINVKQLQNDFVSIQIKKEIEDVNSPDEFEENFTEEEKSAMEKEEAEKKELEKKETEKIEEPAEDVKIKEKEVVVEEKDEHEFKEPEHTRPLTPQIKPQADETNSQCSSQESVVSVKPYEKDDSHLRPTSENSNYNFHDVMQNEHASENEHYQKGAEMEMEGDYEQGNYEMYEQMAMEYQSDVASQRVAPPASQVCARIETVVRARTRGEIKCDWRAGDAPRPAPPARPSRWGHAAPAAPVAPATNQRPSRWGLKPGDVNIVLTGGDGEHAETFPAQSAPAVYRIQSLANRTDNSNSGYDEAYMDMYGASDRLQYGDCFSHSPPAPAPSAPSPAEGDKPQHSSLDDRINLALRTTVLGEVAKDETQEDESPDKGILVTKLLAETRSVKRVSFADGYKPGQDSDTEAPPVMKKKKVRRVGCPWPCPATHRDHVSLWDALPPPPPPPGSPPPPPARAPPAHLLRTLRPPRLLAPPPHNIKFDPNSLAAFMPPEPPPGLISF